MTVRAQFQVPGAAPASNPQPAAPPAAPGSGGGAIGERLVPDFKVTLDGRPLGSPLAENLQQIEIRQSVSLLTMAVLSFDNPGGCIGDADELATGVEVEIEVGYVGEVQFAFRGDIVSLEPVFPRTGTPSVLVRAYDRLHRYQRGHEQRSFLAQKVSDIVSAVAGEEGLIPDVEDTQTRHDYIFQNNQSNIAFIHELGRREGYEVRVVDGGTLSFKKPSATRPKAFTLDWGKTLKSFYVRTSVDNVPTEVVTHFWDMGRKTACVETCTSLDAALSARDAAPQVAERAFGRAEQHITLRPCSSPAEARALAAASFNEAALDAVRGRGTCVGEPQIQPGVVLELLGLGPSWSGEYYVVDATHLLHRAAGYSTAFEVRRTGVGYAAESTFVGNPTAPPPREQAAEPEPEAGQEECANLGCAEGFASASSSGSPLVDGDAAGC